MSVDLSHNAFLSMIGLSLVRWERGLAEFELTLAPHHMNRQGSLQGGVVATMLDAACGYAGLWTETTAPGLDANAVTVSLAINYVARAHAGRLHAVGQLVGGGRSIYFASGEILDAHGGVIATAQGSFKRQPVGTPA